MSVNAEDDSANRIRANYGVYLKKLETVRVITAEWKNWFMINLPNKISVTAHRPNIMCRERRSVDPVFRILADPSHMIRHCGDHEPFSRLLHQIYDTFHKDKMDLLDNIYEIFPDSVTLRNRTRVARGWLDVVGKFGHAAFGLSTDEQLKELSQQVAHALSAGSSGVTQLEHQIDKLASSSKLTNDRIDITNPKAERDKGTVVGHKCVQQRDLGISQQGAPHGHQEVIFGAKHDETI